MSTSDIVIRPTRHADLPAVHAIFAREVKLGTASFELVPPELDEIKRRFDTLGERGYGHLVALADDQVLGYASTGPYRPRPAYRHTVEDSVYVRPDARGRGIAGALMKELIELTRGGDFRQMVAIIGDSENLPSIRVHEKHCFRHVGVLKGVGYKFERWLDTVIMQLDLEPEA